MKHKNAVLVLSFIILLTSCGGKHVLFSEGYSEYCIVIDKDAAASEQYAATELRDWIKEVSGATLPIKDITEGEPGRRLIVGYNSLVSEMNPGSEKPDSSDDSFTWCNKGGDILFWGGSERGTLYSVYSFLEEELDCRWYSDKVSVAPEKTEWTFRKLYNHEKPGFLVRDNCVLAVRTNPTFSARMRNNAVPLPATEPGKTLPGTSEGYWGVHSMGWYIHPKDYFAEHPEYFGMKDGERFGKGNEFQLCLTNPDVLRICTEKIRKAMRDNPDYMVYSMEQIDNMNPCECEHCQALVEKYGGDSGIMLWFVNQVADAVKDEFPGKYVGTFAYRYTRHAPEGIVPRDNVVIRLCSIECCLFHEYGECEENEEFLQDLEDWAAIAPNLYIWDYVTNFSLYCLPVANFKTVQPHIQDFRDHNAIGMMEQNDTQTISTEFKELRTYLLSRLMWNPDADADAIMKDFTDGFYGAAGPYIMEYIEYADSYLRRDGIHTECYIPSSHPMYTSEFVKEGRSIFAKAKAAVADEPEYYERVETSELSLCFLQMELNPAEGFKNGSFEILKKIVERDKILHFDEWYTMPAQDYVKYLEDLKTAFDNAPMLPAHEVKADENGVAYTRYEGNFANTVEMMASGTVTDKGTMPEMAIDEDPLSDHFGFVFDTWFKAEEEGMHVFRITTDDGTVFCVDGQEVFNRDGSHSSITAWTAVNLEKGMHKITVRYFDDSEGQAMKIHLITPGGYEGPLPADRLFIP